MTPADTPPPPPPSPPYPPSYGGPAGVAPGAPRTSAQAVWSLVLGILSMFCLWVVGSIPAIILGALAIGKVNASGGALKGKGLAIAGIVTGSVGVILAPCWAGMAVPVYNSIQEKALINNEIPMIREIVIAMHIYHEDSDGQWPASLEDLRDADGALVTQETADWLARAQSEGRELTFYRYTFPFESPPAGVSADAVPVLSLPAPRAEGRSEDRAKVIVGYANGSTQARPERWLQDQLDALSEYLVAE